MNTGDAIARLMRPARIAVIGASADPTKTTGKPIFYLQKYGYAGQIFPVNPRAADIGGLRCYPDVPSLPNAPDVGLVLLGPAQAHAAVGALAARGTAAAIVLAGGYAETGADGIRLQRELLEAAGCMRLLGPNTIGLVNLTDGVPLSASGALDADDPPRGGIALLSQSGGILGALLSHAAARGIGLSKLVATSNEADLDVGDFIDFLADDPATSVIALYLETIRDAPKFRAAARRAAQAGKPIVAFKVGRSAAGVRAVVSHTGALAGADRMYDALFERVGVIRAQRYPELLDISMALSPRRVLRGKRVAILTSTGGAGSLLSDSLGLAGLATPPPEGITAERLRALQGESPALLDHNPIDVTLAGLKPDLLQAAIDAVADSSGYDAVVVVVGSSSLSRPDLVAGVIRNVLPRSDKPILAYVSPSAPQVVHALGRSGIPAFSTPEGCAAGLTALLKASDAARRASAAARATPGAAVEVPLFGAGALDEQQAKQVFAAFGVPGVREIAVVDAAQAAAAAEQLGGRIVLKILSGDITHKSDVGGVAVDVLPAEVATRLESMARVVQARTGSRPARFLVQAMVSGGIELIIGLHRDSLGAAVLLGTGGVTAELMGDHVLRMLPEAGGLSEAEGLDMVQSLRAWPLLNGYRGRPKADVAALAACIVAFSHMAAQLGDAVVAAEINPLFVMSEGEGVAAADGILVLK